MEESDVPAPRSAGLIAVVMAVAFLLVPWVHLPAYAKTVEQVRREPTNLAELRKEAEQSAKELEDATRALEKRRTDIATSEKQLKTTLASLQQMEQRLSVMRQPVSQLAELLYEQPLAQNSIIPFLSGNASEKTLRAFTNVTQMVAVRQQAVEQTSALYEQAEKLASEAQELRAGNLLAEAQLAAEVNTLRQRSDKIVKSLTAALVKLGVKIDKSGKDALGCNPLHATSAGDYPNGLL